VDIFEDERDVVVFVALPGVPAQRIEVTTESGDLVVRGERALPLRLVAVRLAAARDPVRFLRAEDSAA
jgi:hypothetical protein